MKLKKGDRVKAAESIKWWHDEAAYCCIEDDVLIVDSIVGIDDRGIPMLIVRHEYARFLFTVSQNQVKRS